MKQYEKLFADLFSEMSETIIGQQDVIEQILIAMLCDSNALLEGYPGLGKTLAIKTLAGLMDLKFTRIQGTPDIMPSDITGTYILEERDGKRYFAFQKGPLFGNIVLADEINRATPKTQSALLEAMQEKQVTVGSTTFKLDTPFFVLATQNPIEQEGTYPLPEAQADRFLFKIRINYPTFEDEMKIVNLYAESAPERKDKIIIDKRALLGLQSLTKKVPIANDLKTRVLKIVTATRAKKGILEYGASPRASIGLMLAAKARALMKGRSYVSNEDINMMAYPVLRHRIILSFEAERKGMSPDDVISDILAATK